jgi:hypothetical protein
MTDQPDFADLARQYLDLWEDQLAAMAADPDLAEQSARFFETMTRLGGVANPMMAANLATLMGQMAGSGGPKTDGTNGSSSQDTETGAATAAAASPDRDERLDELARRLADVEKRLDGLEAGGRQKGRAAPKKSA